MGGSGAGINGPQHLRDLDSNMYEVNSRERIEPAESMIMSPPQLSSHHFGVNK